MILQTPLFGFSGAPYPVNDMNDDPPIIVFFVVAGDLVVVVRGVVTGSSIKKGLRKSMIKLSN